MKKLLGLVCGMAMLGSAEAKVVSYDFTVTVQHIVEMDNFNPVYVQSSTRPGALVSVGEQVHGSFSYDTDTPFSLVYQPPAQAQGNWVLYSDPAHYKNPIDAVFQNSGLHSTAPGMPTTSNNSVQVADNATTFQNGDVFWLGNSASYQGEIFTNSIILGDSTGAVFNSTTIPDDLNLTHFNYGSYAFSRMSADGRWVEVDADFTSLTLSPPPVPEPSTYLMFGAGAMLLAWRRKSRG
ncbi:PEP-CTERM sorting domain-containing protein [Oxalobacteraceae bacterium]|nr:PEP-CTERM sorting domain-containing protein [Oxalobacteraceae bacterium]